MAAAIRSDISYIIKGPVGSSIYTGVTVYEGEAQDSVSISANISTASGLGQPHASLSAKDGMFSILLKTHGATEVKVDGDYCCLPLKPLSHTVIIRRYFSTRAEVKPEHFSIEPVGISLQPPAPPCQADTASALTRLTSLAKGWFRLAPMPLPAQPQAFNRVCPPFPASASTGHWSTPDNFHSFGFFKLSGNQALILRGKNVPCVYWSVHLWNCFMQTFDYRFHSCALSNSDIKPAEDGSWSVVVSITDPSASFPGCKWLSTAGNDHGFIYFRWLVPQSPPQPVATELINLV